MKHPLMSRSHEDRVARWLIRVNGTIENAYVKAFERAHGYQIGRDWGVRDRSLWHPFWRRVCRKLRQVYMLKQLGPAQKTKRRMTSLDTRCKY